MGAIADHLWQSTWFALTAWVLALLVRKDAARIRYWVWFAASIKFLFPFAVLSWIGNLFILQVDDEEALLPLVQHMASPLTSAMPIEHFGKSAQQLLIAAWALVTVALLGRWLLSWLHSRRLVRSSLPCSVIAPVPVRCSDRIAAPCVVGIVEPVLLLPRGLLSDLSPGQLDAILAHEMWHVRRRDNLAASLHAWVEALFWFHPLVWWIGAKLVREREHACDEGAIQDGHEPRAYAETLLKVCRHSIALQSACIANAAGGDLSARIRGIMLQQPKVRFGAARCAVLAAVFFSCAALPVASGMTLVMTSAVTVAAGARSIRVSEAAGPTYIIVHDDYVYGRNVSLRELIGGAFSVRANDVAGAVRWLDQPRYDIELAAPRGGATDHRQLVADLLEQQFNVELIVRPTVRAKVAD